MRKVTIGDLGDIYTGNTPSKKNVEFYDSEDIMFIKPDILDFDINTINESNEYVSERAREKARIIPKDSLLVSCIGNIGKLGINKKEAAFNQQINAIVHNEKIVSSRYLAYLIKYNQKKLEAIANAPVVPIINKTQFSNFELFIHENLETQNKIVEVLDKAQSLIDKKKEQIELLDELVKSRFVEMFGDINKNNKTWDVKILSELIDVIGGYAFKSTEFVEEGIPVLKIGNINAGYFKDTNLMFWNEETKLERYLIRPGDLVISLTGTVGKDDYGNVCIMGKDYDKYYLNQRNAKLDIRDENILSKLYLTYALKVPEIKKRLTGISRGVRQANISNKDIQNLELPIPPIELQNEFAEFVTKTDSIRSKMEASLSELEDNFNSLMQKAFKGELF